MKTIGIIVVLGAILLSSVAHAQASIIPNGASLGYMNTAKGGDYFCGILSWQVSDKTFWDRFTIDLIVPARSGSDDAFVMPTLGLGFEVARITPKLHIGVTALLPAAQGHLGYYVSYDVLTF